MQTTHLAGEKDGRPVGKRAPKLRLGSSLVRRDERDDLVCGFLLQKV